MSRLVLHYHGDDFLAHETEDHPERPARLEAISRGLSHPKLAAALVSRPAKPATDEAILRCHDREHLDRVDATKGRSGYFDPDTLYCPDSARVARLAAGSVVDAAEALRSGERGAAAAFCAVRPPGHHATASRAMGFCLFNNAAIAARHLLAAGLERVLIVDWDVHHGNGTQDIFWEDPAVFYYSLHQFPHYPGTGGPSERGGGPGVGTTLNRPLPAGCPAAKFRDLFAADVERVTKEFRPEFVILSCGFDAHHRDPLGDLRLDDHDYAWMTRFLIERSPPGRLLSVLEGGYDLPALTGAVAAHVGALAGIEANKAASDAGDSPRPDSP